MTKKKLYKVLVDGKSCHGGNTEWVLGRWTPTIQNLKICYRGYHLTDKPYKWFKWGADVYEAEAKGVSQDDAENSKIVCSSARIVKKVAKPKWLKDTELFVKSIEKIPFFKMQGSIKAEWKVSYGESWDAARAAARAAARDAARDAAWDAARDAAWNAARAAVWDAARAAARDAARAAVWDAAWDAARDAARNAARDAARDAARAAARDAARAAARDAAWDAGIMAQIKVCAGLNLDKKHIVHAKARMEVWKRGYGLACDANGVLYVYALRKINDYPIR